MLDSQKDFVTVVVAAAVAEYTRDSGTWQNAEKLHVIRMVPEKWGKMSTLAFFMNNLAIFYFPLQN